MPHRLKPHPAAFPNEPYQFNPQELDRLLVHAYEHDVSDINIQSDDQVIFDVAGGLYRVTTRALTNPEVESLVNHLWGTNAGMGILRSGEDIDCSYQLRIVSSCTTIRFRVNITMGLCGDREGIQITMRTIKSCPPLLSDLGIEQALIDAYEIENGLVAVCGETGSGKSTLLSAMMRNFIQRPESHIKLLTYEAPIEYTYGSVTKPNALVHQSEVPRHVKSFALGVRNALRRAPSHILVGESRDRETMEAALEASQTGHGVFTTLHVNSVHEALYRAVNLFQPNERATKMYEIVESLRVVIVQRLAPKVGGGRTAIREFLIFNQDIRDSLREATSVTDLVKRTRELVEAKGQTFLTAAQAAHSAGLISDSYLAHVKASQHALAASTGLDG